MDIKTEFSLIDSDEKIIFEILAENLKNELDDIFISNHIDVTAKKKNKQLFATLLQANDNGQLDDLNVKDTDLINISESDFASKIETSNMILSRLVLKIIESSSKSIENLEYIKKAAKKKELAEQQTSMKDFVNENITNHTSSFSPSRARYTPRTNFDDKSYFKCVICSQKFARKEKLRQHLRKHINSKPYTCQRCNKKFIKKNHLDLHAKSSPCQNLVQINVASSMDIRNRENIMQTSPSPVSEASSLIEEGLMDDTVLTKTNRLDATTARVTKTPTTTPDIIWFNPMEFIKSNYRRY